MPMIEELRAKRVVYAVPGMDQALARNLTLDLMTHPRGQHAFDILDDDQRSCEIIQRTIAFLSTHLSS